MSSNSNYSVNELYQLACELTGKDVAQEYASDSHYWENYPALFQEVYRIKEETLNHEINKYTLCDNVLTFEKYGWKPVVDMREGRSGSLKTSLSCWISEVKAGIFGRLYMEKVHLIMPMGGAGSRFAECGYDLPKPLIMLHDRPFFFWATQSLARFLDYVDITFVVLQEHIDRFDIMERIREYYPKAKFHVLPEVLPGPMFTCLEGVAGIDDAAPVIFNDCDHMFMCKELYHDMNQGTVVEEGALLTFTSNDPRFSYVREDDWGNVVGTVEKKVVSTHAICGAYLFRNKDIFLETAEAYKQECPYKEFFMSGMYNILCKQQKKIKNYVLDFHVDYGTPAEYEAAKDSSYFKYLE